MPFSLGQCWIYVCFISRCLGISRGIVHNIVSLFVETIKTSCFMLYINIVNGVSYFKSEISLVSFSLTGTYMYFISDTQFQTVANVSRCLKCALSFPYANLFTFLCEFNVEFKLSVLTAHQLKCESSGFCPDVSKRSDNYVLCLQNMYRKNEIQISVHNTRYLSKQIKSTVCSWLSFFLLLANSLPAL